MKLIRRLLTFGHRRSPSSAPVMLFADPRQCLAGFRALAATDSRRVADKARRLNADRTLPRDGGDMHHAQRPLAR